MAQDYSQVNFRIPTKLKEKIEAAAVSNERSITAELVMRLEKSFEEQAVVSGMSLDDYKKAAQEVFKETVIAHMKQHDDRREQNLIEMTHRQAAMIEKLMAENEALRKRETPE